MVACIWDGYDLWNLYLVVLVVHTYFIAKQQDCRDCRSNHGAAEVETSTLKASELVAAYRNVLDKQIPFS